MGSFANTLFTLLLGWLQGIVSALWSAFTNENGQSLVTWIGRHWLLIAGILCVIGLTADLCVYVFRWKPFRVWRSFFAGKQDPEEQREDENARTEIPDHHTGRERDRKIIRQEEPDLSKWKRNEVQKKDAEYSQMMTKAGYSVPADSPYRRPAGQSPDPAGDDLKSRPETESAPETNEDSGPVSVKSKRRRRISVNELFADPEEELREIDAPQDLFDRKKAYHEPVYPRNWKKSEDNEQ